MDKTEETLDPADWESSRALAHQMVDDAIEHLSRVPDRHTWKEMPQSVREGFTTPVPQGPSDLATVYKDLQENMLPYSMGNIHPRFWGWYMGSSNFTGALGDFLAAIDGSNLGGGNTSAAAVDEQVVNWFKEIVGFPSDASGTLTSGGSMANMVAHTVVRNTKAGVDVRAQGIASMPKPLRFYASDQVHSCHQKSLEALGLGAVALCEVPTDDHQRMDIEALKGLIAQDVAAGIKPACVVGTAGTTNTGAIDNLSAIADICEENDIWFHVDGCIGAFLKMSPKNKSLVDGMERARSVALDPHKWLHTPFEAGCVLIRDADSHFNAFEMHGDYLQLHGRGIAVGKFLADYSYELSRGFKALKIWMSLKENGVEKFGRLIDQNMDQAKYLEQLVHDNPQLELVAPVDLNIVCFRYRADGLDEEALKSLNIEIMLRIQESGLAIPSDTTIGGKHCLRVAINNHRTKREDLDLFISKTCQVGAEIAEA